MCVQQRRRRGRREGWCVLCRAGRDGTGRPLTSGYANLLKAGGGWGGKEFHKNNNYFIKHFAIRTASASRPPLPGRSLEPLSSQPASRSDQDRGEPISRRSTPHVELPLLWSTKWAFLRRMASSGMLRRMAFVRTEVHPDDGGEMYPRTLVFHQRHTA
jgi:hypothetical protein